MPIRKLAALAVLCLCVATARPDVLTQAAKRTASGDEFPYVGTYAEKTLRGITNGGLKEIQTVSPVPADYKDRSSTAEIPIDRAGKFVYVSNRGHNGIAVFSVVDPATGKLTQSGAKIEMSTPVTVLFVKAQ